MLLPESNAEGFFKMTYLEGYWELEGILADLGFSAKVHVWKNCVLKENHLCSRNIRLFLFLVELSMKNQKSNLDIGFGEVWTQG